MRSARLTTPAVSIALLLSGCIVDTTPSADRQTPDAERRPEPGSDPDAEVRPGSDGGLIPGPDAEVRPGPDAEVRPGPDAAPDPDAAPGPDAGPPPGTCAALCADRASGLQPEGGCPVESFRTPGISYDCTETCARAQAWTRGMDQAALACVREEYLCFETLEQCAIRRGTLGERLSVTLELTEFTSSAGKEVGFVSEAEGEAIRALVDADGHVSIEVEVDLERVSFLGFWLWVDDGDGLCQPDLDGFAVLWLSPLEQIGGPPEEHPLASGRMHGTFTPRGIGWTDAPESHREICAALSR